MKKYFLSFLVAFLLVSGEQANAGQIPFLDDRGKLVISGHQGPEIYRTRNMEAFIEGRYAVINMPTNNPGSLGGIDYDNSDLFGLRVKDNKYVLAVKTAGGNKGFVYSYPEFITNEYFKNAGLPITRFLDGSFMPVQASAAGVCHHGFAEISRKPFLDEYLLSIRIPLDVFWAFGIFGKIKFICVTAYCGNGPVEAEIEIPPPPEEIPWGGCPGATPIPTICPLPTSVAFASASGVFFGGGVGVFGGGGEFCHKKYPPWRPPCPPPPTPPLAPLPGTLFLLAGGLAGLVIAGWRKK